MLSWNSGAATVARLPRGGGAAPTDCGETPLYIVVGQT